MRVRVGVGFRARVSARVVVRVIRWLGSLGLGLG